MPKFLDDEGHPIDSEFALSLDGDAFAVFLESRGGGRNDEYRRGLQTLIERFGTLQAQVVDILVASRKLQGESDDVRRVSLPGWEYPLSLSGLSSVESLVAEIGRGQAAVGRAPGAKGEGNRTKRLKIRFRCSWEIDDAAGLEAALSGESVVGLETGVALGIVCRSTKLLPHRIDASG